jgi:hypothetical protein
LNGSDLLDGSEWEELIVKALPRLKEYIGLENFNFSKEQAEAIFNNSLHLETIWMENCKFRKWCFVQID